MTLQIEGIEIEELGISVEEIKLELALIFYSKGKLPIGKASSLANINKIFFKKN